MLFQGHITAPYSVSNVSLVFTACAVGPVFAPLGIRLHAPCKRDFQACRAHAVTLVGIGMQPAYALPQPSPVPTSTADGAEALLSQPGPFAAAASAAVPQWTAQALAAVARAGAVGHRALLPFSAADEAEDGDAAAAAAALASSSMSAGDVRSELLRMQRWLLQVDEAEVATGPPPLLLRPEECKSRLERPRFDLSPDPIRLLADWQPSAPAAAGASSAAATASPGAASQARSPALPASSLSLGLEVADRGRPLVLVSHDLRISAPTSNEPEEFIMMHTPSTLRFD